MRVISADGRVKTAFILTLVGSILNLVTGLFILTLLHVVLTATNIQALTHHMSLVGLMMPLVAKAVLPLIALITLTPGVLGLIASLLIRYGYVLAGGLLAIIAALISIPIMLGSLLVGFVALLIGGILALTRS